MKDIHYDFVDLDSDEALWLLAKTLGGVIENKTLYFDNPIAKGELIKATPDEGLWIRKWKFTVFQKITLHKLAAPAEEEKKICFIYFLNPSIFHLKSKRKRIVVNNHHNNVLVSNNVSIDFSVLPKQPFYVLDIAFTVSWLLKQFGDADPSFKKGLDDLINKNTQTVLIEPCSAEEYIILHELEVSMTPENDDLLFIRSRAYNLILSFISKILNHTSANVVQNTVDYERIMQVEMMIRENLTELPKLDVIAKKVNMSISSLLRQFKVIYGKTIYEYYIEKRMEFAKKMILENNVTVKEVAEMLGYHQASPFIESFTKYFGYSPGSLKLMIA